ncbi:hypothetical protein BKA65DRAFT_215427 [Rhexocercosporidium sp. MPI-PUGE-AT-0058]|nr:hypothetical protein BKA65DRAFT_215427 [Rhexocercosporidium sp. MPI-PUGE-AT-0058]
MKFLLNIPIRRKFPPLIKFLPISLPFRYTHPFRGGDFAFCIGYCLGVAVSGLLGLFVLVEDAVDEFLMLVEDAVDEFLVLGRGVGHGVVFSMVTLMWGERDICERMVEVGVDIPGCFGSY